MGLIRFLIKKLSLLFFPPVKQLPEIKKPKPKPKPLPSKPIPNIPPEFGASSLFLQKVNTLRKYLKIPLLEIDEKLTRMAQNQADYQNETRRMTHRGRGGSTLSERARNVNYGGWVRENVAYGCKNQATLYALWASSEGHRLNMQEEKCVKMGLARSGDYWCAVFGS